MLLQDEINFTEIQIFKIQKRKKMNNYLICKNDYK